MLLACHVSPSFEYSYRGLAGSVTLLGVLVIDSDDGAPGAAGAVFFNTAAVGSLVRAHRERRHRNR